MQQWGQKIGNFFQVPAKETGSSLPRFAQQGSRAAFRKIFLDADDKYRAFFSIWHSLLTALLFWSHVLNVWTNLCNSVVSTLRYLSQQQQNYVLWTTLPDKAIKNLQNTILKIWSNEKRSGLKVVSSDRSHFKDIHAEIFKKVLQPKTI